MEISTRTNAVSGLTKRRCVACGCSARALQRPVERRPSWCPACHADLYARPPRSYAEMEGICASPVVRRERLDLMGFFERSLAIAMGVVVSVGLIASAMR